MDLCPTKFVSYICEIFNGSFVTQFLFVLGPQELHLTLILNNVWHISIDIEDFV